MGAVVEVVDTYLVINVQTDEQITLEFKRPVSSTSWELVHKQNRFPVVTVVDNSGNVVWPDVAYPDRNTVLVAFSHPFAGVATSTS